LYKISSSLNIIEDIDFEHRKVALLHRLSTMKDESYVFWPTDVETRTPTFTFHTSMKAYKLRSQISFYMQQFNRQNDLYALKTNECDRYIHSFIHLVVCLTTGPKPLPKQALHIVRSRASSFK